MRSAISLIRASSSSNFPLFIVASSSRLKWVKTAVQSSALKDSAATNIPHCIISWARPMLRRKLDLPPWFAPVTITRLLPSASTVLPTTACSMLERKAEVVQLR
ncbi:MAG: hypothetical protein MZW92_37265 [Comamonadaceae bacterium]|nr:hypothetical protein [Comamonadaceae bacterium]